MAKEEEDKGFKVIDKRLLFRPEEEKEKIKDSSFVPTRVGTSEKEEVPPALDFASFILSLSTQTFIHFGDLADPLTKKVEKNLALAKQTIDLLGLLEEKTRGNLTPDEDGLLKNLLYDLRMRYVREIPKKS